jgi:hypothetical protein
MIVCRVIAGRIKNLSSSSSSDASQSQDCYDSAASSDDLEELLVFDPTAVLPCFVVLYRC